MASTNASAPNSSVQTHMHVLDVLRRQYYAHVPAYLLRIPPAEALRSAEGQAALVNLATDESPPLPEAGYRKSFWKRVLPAVEASFENVGEDEDGVDEQIYEAVADAMAAAGPASGMPAASAKTFIYDSSQRSDGSAAERMITLYEEQVAVQAGTTGLRTWTAALHCAHHFLSSPDALFGRPTRAVLELGAGTGFLSAVLAHEGVGVIATDLGDDDCEGEEDAGGLTSGDVDGGIQEGARATPLGRLRANLSNNGLPVRALPLDWAHAALPASERPAAWRQVLAPVDRQRRDLVAADVIYDPDIVPLLVNAIRVLLTENVQEDQERPVAVLAATVRNEQTFKLFLDTCVSSGLTTTILDLQPMDADSPTFWDTALDRGTRVEIVRIAAR